MNRQRSIQIQGARTHNLKNISCEIPHGSFTVVTGPSGSGKSSLAFDTLYAEGHRRFVESMSTYTRQFLERIEKPDVDRIQYILPTIALEQKNHIKNARSTVGTATEIYDFLRVLFATIGITSCDECGGTVSKATPQTSEGDLKTYPVGTKLFLTAPVSLNDFSLSDLIARGYFRAYVKGDIVDLNQGFSVKHEENELDILIDRLILKGEDTASRLSESIRKALELNPKRIKAHLVGNVPLTPALSPNGGEGAFSFPLTPALSPNGGEEVKVYHMAFVCQKCYKSSAEPFPNMFSFNNPLGACKSCEGFGKIIGLNLDKVIPNRHLSLREGAIHPFNTPSNLEIYESLISEGEKQNIRLDIPFEDLSVEEKRFVLEGKRYYPGVYKFFEWLESKKYKVHVRVMLAKYRGYYLCPDCNGSRLRPEALQVRINNHNINDLSLMPVAELSRLFKELTLTEKEFQVAERLLKEIKSRLQYLEEIGLGYLTLARQSRTLSGGEAQRINLSASLGSALTDTLYVLDEPTVGLHARDTKRLLHTLKTLRDYGNTLVVVEHDPEIILGADRVIDLGPSGGKGGGHIVYEGDTERFLETTYSQTACFLRNPPPIKLREIEFPEKPEDKSSAETDNWIEILGACGNNLKNINVKIPKNRLVCVSGVSGSGKSTLIKQTLYANYQQERGHELAMEVAPCLGGVIGLDSFRDLILVDQSPPGRSVRSNPVTYVKAYDEIRKLFASTRQAQALGVTASHFSFNSVGGRCETCEGLGTITIYMQFMADITITCHDCQGKRFSPSLLSIMYEGKNINEVLNLTVDEAIDFFKKNNRVVRKLLPLSEIGLGYLHLGQATSTLSGGEAQRLKLASYISTRGKNSNAPSPPVGERAGVRGNENAPSPPLGERAGVRGTFAPSPPLGDRCRVRENAESYLFLFDEPTTGLHLTDIHILIGALRRLLDSGHSIIVVEHNIEFLSHADYIIDLGPEGGDAGGMILAEGPPESIMRYDKSYTGEFLRQRIGK